jgi:hypothetical protein
MSGAVDRADRAQRAIRMLCEVRGARMGHLFLRHSRGIELVASYGAPPPADGLRDFLQRCLHLEHEQAGSATTLEHDADSDSTAVSWWADAVGQVHHPWVLFGRVGGAVRQIGVASLVIDDAHARPANDPQLYAALVAYLIESGDVRDPETPSS